MFEFVDVLSQKRRFVNAAVAVSASMLLVCALAPLLQPYNAAIAARVQAASAGQVAQPAEDSPDVVTNALARLLDGAGQATNKVEVSILSGMLSLAKGITRFDKDMMHGTRSAVIFTLHGAVKSVVLTGRLIGSVFTFSGHIVGDVFSLTSHGIGAVLSFSGHVIGNIFGVFHIFTHLSSIIRPQDHTPAPTITQLRAQQAALIQSGTMNVSIAVVTSGRGGACDAGDGNGGYPMAWCNAPMDSIATVPYTSDSINRECTSYAYWYFTSVEGYTGFRAWGNAKYWAATSNFPTHVSPAVGAIAVETAGTYGHVAIVQALPGQKYAGQVVPAGYVLVSEMNYDWDGHFRYSYSPISKFSAYIYS